MAAARVSAGCQEIVDHLARNRWNFQHHPTAGIARMTTDAWEKANAIYPIARLTWAMLHPGQGSEHSTAETLARLEALGAGVTPTDSAAQGDTAHPRYRAHVCAHGRGRQDRRGDAEFAALDN